MFISWVHFLALYLITGAVLRWFSMKFPANPLSDAILFVHG